MPIPGGTNRIQLEVEKSGRTGHHLEIERSKFRNDIVKANVGDQILIADPSGNLIELFESKEVAVH